MVRGELPKKCRREYTANNDAIESLKQDIIVHCEEFLLVPVVTPSLNQDDQFAYKIDAKVARPQQLMTDGQKSKEQGTQCIYAYKYIFANGCSASIKFIASCTVITASVSKGRSTAHLVRQVSIVCATSGEDF